MGECRYGSDMGDMRVCIYPLSRFRCSAYLKQCLYSPSIYNLYFPPVLAAYIFHPVSLLSVYIPSLSIYIIFPPHTDIVYQSPQAALRDGRSDWFSLVFQSLFFCFVFFSESFKIFFVHFFFLIILKRFILTFAPLKK